MNITRANTLDVATQDILPGGDSMEVRRFLVVHFTGGWGAKGTIDFWRRPEAKGANAHLVIDRDGRIWQCRPFNRTAGHAGVSRWRDPNTGVLYRGLNSCSIGIELCNCGDLPRDRYPATMSAEFAQRLIPRLKAKHKNGGPVAAWEKYDQRQLDALTEVSRLLIDRYNLDDVVGHDDIAPERKNDPGPAFPMDAFRRSLGFTAL